MAGMKDEAGWGGGRRCLADDHLAQLQAMTDECMGALAAVELKPGDVLAVERKTRAIGAMARTIKLVDGLRPKPGKSHTHDNQDTEMREGDETDGGADDDGKLDRVRAELERRLDRLAATLETKRAAGLPRSDEGGSGPERHLGPP